MTAPTLVDTQESTKSCMDLMLECQQTCSKNGEKVMFNFCMTEAPWNNGTVPKPNEIISRETSSMCSCLPTQITKSKTDKTSEKECDNFFNERKKEAGPLQQDRQPSGVGVCIEGTDDKSKSTVTVRNLVFPKPDKVIMEMMVEAFYLEAPVLFNVTDTCRQHEQACKSKCPDAKFTCQPNDYLLLTAGRQPSFSVKYDCVCPDPSKTPPDSSKVSKITGGKLKSSAGTSRISTEYGILLGIVTLAGSAWTICSGLTRSGIVSGAKKTKSD